MVNRQVLKNQRLEVTIRLPGSQPESERFDSSCVVEQVLLDGEHTFCQPEQKIASRVTCWGFGLNAEFDMNDVARKARKGELFPKPGVGLMTQIEDNRPYDMWKHYEIARYPKKWACGPDWIEFTEEQPECLGISLKIIRRLSLRGNEIHLQTEIRNTGSVRAEFSEYQHNFVAIDDLPVQKGYRLEIPFDQTIDQLPERFVLQSDYTARAESSVRVKGQTVIWTDGMDGKAYHKTTPAEKIADLPSYSWRLFRDDCAVSIQEKMDFKPWRLGLWGIEHCICPEVYCRICVNPGETQTYTRQWIFES